MPDASQFDGDANRAFYSTAAVEYQSAQGPLLPGEQALLDAVGPEFLARARLLDLGVGGGRTTTFLAPRVREYVGVDYSPVLIESCRRQFVESDQLRFLVGDARSLHLLDLGRFDIVVFSYNGIDYVDHSGRLEILAQIRRLLNDGGVFFFSSHSIHGASKVWAWAGVNWRQPGRTLIRLAKAAAKALPMMWVNRNVDMKASRQQGFVMLNDGSHRLKMITYYVDPVEQRRQLVESGFDLLAVLDHDGNAMEVDAPKRGWISYWSRRSSGSSGDGQTQNRVGL